MKCAAEVASDKMAGPIRAPRVRERGKKPADTHSARQHRALFVDIDGVLHPTTVDGSAGTGDVVHTTLFGWLPVLSRALQPHPDVVIVVHSTWRYTHDLEELRGVLGALGSRVVGATPRGPRYESILWWLNMNPQFANYRVLDDDPREFPSPAPSELILCNPATGVSAPDVLHQLNLWLAGAGAGQ
jgi:hypothetical protein